MKLNVNLSLIVVLSFVFGSGSAQRIKTENSTVSKVWVADNGDGTYKNPILHADYSDPDAIRVGDDFYMTASSFNCVPGLPILHSTDLVNWELISYALPKQPPFDVFDKPQHGNGVWAPCIRHHKGEFYIYYPDPDFGIYLTKATGAKGPWSEPLLVKEGKGLIDPSPLWDDDGNAYLVFALAGSRAGVKSILLVSRMKADGTELLGDPVMVFDGHKNHPTVEGPKFYKRNGCYYIFAPAGGVSTGWQLVLRSKNVFGPYEEKIVLEQGSTTINGPHQGAWVDTSTGGDWFIHFQDKGAYGRIVHLQPVKWENDWPVIGVDYDGNGIGEPVSDYKKSDAGTKSTVITPPENDEFDTPQLSLQWQWHANPQLMWGFSTGNMGFYRLNCIPKTDNFVNLWTVPNLLLQKFPAEEFTATAKLTFNHRFDGEEIGFVVMGDSYQFVSLKRLDGKLILRVVKCDNARTGSVEKELFQKEFPANTVYFRIKIKSGALCSFSFSMDGKKFTEAGEAFRAVPGRWIGAKIGFFALRDGVINDAGNADIDWFRIEK
ncbi:MAG: glycoside hydrolase [Bacteroidetes bacterium GWF2_42_66]|nr:MAG: glycoside hydrolase [Bacteroidetes bacterium GWA2_42_15]OFY02614.1 MAG: glycoside hydrolase [Bacteroidetes bacterium GWE2_42_39]OFY41286.1 MAG: glycoside hydrolase [Bacteroidetes bacterium GWF2_42_66]HBL75522.1 glycoside hydrolase [Prolixibacteraceae bacterium]HCR90510.1 glycoside hydrolase [Prolixibacteraceae bacterium]